MDRSYLIHQLARHGDVFRALFTCLTPREIHWKPAPEKWCALEIICHLCDEEREDFRARLSSTLETPEKPWPKIDPPAWVTERKYMDQDFDAKVASFIGERDRSVALLRGSTDAPWGNAYMHPTVGPVSCDLLLTNWVAHDLHHFRQLNNLHYGYLASISTVPLDYAGKW
ncbi:MAG: DinB family protein [Flavobacteriales bacterium]